MPGFRCSRRWKRSSMRTLALQKPSTRMKPSITSTLKRCHALLHCSFYKTLCKLTWTLSLEGWIAVRWMETVCQQNLTTGRISEGLPLITFPETMHIRVVLTGGQDLSSNRICLSVDQNIATRNRSCLFKKNTSSTVFQGEVFTQGKSNKGLRDD